MFDSLLDSLMQKILNLFDTPFVHMLEWTVPTILGAVLIGYFFPQLRALAGTALVAVAAAWYGYHQGQKSKEDQE